MTTNSAKIRNVIVENDKLTSLEVVLLPDTQMEVVGLLIDQSSLIDTPPGTTIISEKMIQSLPHQK